MFVTRQGGNLLQSGQFAQREAHIGQRGGITHRFPPACNMPCSVAFGDRLGYFQGNMTDTVLLSSEGPRATITLNDPAKHNRLDPAGLGLLRQAIEKADAAPDVRVTVITGAGEKTFCSGYDLGSIPSGKSARPADGEDSFEKVMDRLEAMHMPTLCALNGGVYGGATDMALACDFRLGVKGMRFFMPAARFGLHYYPSGLRRYTQKVSPSFAKRAFLLSEDFTDEDLLRVGYLDWLVDRAQVKTRVHHAAAFTLTRDAIKEAEASFREFSMDAMWRPLELDLRDEVEKFGNGARINLSRNIEGLRWTLQARDQKSADLLSQKVSERLERSQQAYLKSYMRRMVGERRVMVDFAAATTAMQSPLRAVAKALGDVPDVANDDRAKIALALSFFQEIPYAVLEDKQRRGGDLLPGPALLAQNRGDCDSKAVALAAVLTEYSRWRKLAIVTMPGHAILAVHLPAQEVDWIRRSGRGPRGSL